MKRQDGEGTWGTKIVKGYKYHFYRDSDGHYTYGKTVKAVKEKYAKYQDTKFTINTKTTFGEYIQYWLTTKQKTLEPTTYDCYETMISSQIINFKDYDIANQQLHNLSTAKFQKYLDTLAAQYSRSTIVKIWAIIKQCIKYAEIEDVVPLHCTDLVKVPLESQVAVKKKEIPFLSLEEADKLYNTLKLTHDNGIPYFGENAYALMLLMYSGARISEILALKWKNVDMKNHTITIEESMAQRKNRNNDGKNKYITYDKTPKNEHSIRKVPLPKRGMEIIRYFNAKNPDHKPTDYVCINSKKHPMARRNVNHTLKRMLKMAELPDCSAHTLRHTYGSILLQNGVEIKKVSELLGHNNISTTYDIYIGILEKDKSSEVTRVFDIDTKS